MESYLHPHLQQHCSQEPGLEATCMSTVGRRHGSAVQRKSGRAPGSEIGWSEGQPDRILLTSGPWSHHIHRDRKQMGGEQRAGEPEGRGFEGRSCRAGHNQPCVCAVGHSQTDWARAESDAHTQHTDGPPCPRSLSGAAGRRRTGRLCHPSVRGEGSRVRGRKGRV